MSYLKIPLTDELRSKATARAAEAGYDDLGQYFTSLLQAEIDRTDASANLPQHLTFRTEQELLDCLAAGQSSPPQEYDREHWEQKKQKLKSQA